MGSGAAGGAGYAHRAGALHAQLGGCAGAGHGPGSPGGSTVSQSLPAERRVAVAGRRCGCGLLLFICHALPELLRPDLEALVGPITTGLASAAGACPTTSLLQSISGAEQSRGSAKPWTLLALNSSIRTPCSQLLLSLSPCCNQPRSLKTTSVVVIPSSAAVSRAAAAGHHRRHNVPLKPLHRPLPRAHSNGI